MANITSEQIKIFPVSTNRDSDPASRLFYEHNIANIIRQISDYKYGFIINGPSKFNGTLEADLELCIYGYYLKILNHTVIFSDLTDTYVVAKLDLQKISLENSDFIYQLLGQDDLENTNIDDSNSFKPLNINCISNSRFSELMSNDFIEENDEGISVYLPLYKRSGDTYEICTDSLRKLNSSSVNIVRINGKREV